MDIKGEFPKTIDNHGTLGKHNESLVNLFYTEKKSGGMLMPRFGIGRLDPETGVSASDDVRCIYGFKGSYYVIRGTRINPITLHLAKLREDLGSVGAPTGGDLLAVSGHTQAVFIQKTGGAAFYTTDNVTFTGISSNYVASVDMDIIAGRMVYVPADGGPVFYSDVNAFQTIPAANFFDPEDVPDENIGVININEDLHVLGAETIRVFRAVGTGSSTFRKIEGAGANVGYIGGKIRYKETFLFVGKDRDQGMGIFIMGQGSAQRISTPYVDSIIASISNFGLDNVFASRVFYEGYDLIFFSFDNNCIMFHNGNWSFAVMNDKFGMPWKHVTQVYDKSIDDEASFVCVLPDRETGDAVSTFSGETLGIIEQGYRDNNSDNTYELESYVRHPEDKVFTASHMRFSIQTEQGRDETESISLQVANVRRGNVVYGPAITKDAQNLEQIVFRPAGGMGRFNGEMRYKLSATGGVAFGTDNFEVGINA